MPLTTATITFDISDQVGADFDARRTKVWVTTNVPDETVIDTTGNQIRLGSGRGTIDQDGTGSVSVWVPGAGANPASWQTTVHVDYADAQSSRGRKVRSFGPFTISGDADLADLVAEQEVPAQYLTTVTTSLQALLDEAEDAASSASSSRLAVDVAAAASLAASSDALAKGNGLVQAIIALQGGTQGLFLDDDGRPFFDPGYSPGPGEPALALLVDTDGVPYFTGA